MTETSMPQRGGIGDGEAVVNWSCVSKRVEVAGGITSEQNCLRLKILDREPKSVKFDSDRIITSKCSNRHKILNKRWTNKDIGQF
jgi:hypothetical protein